jgi:hypothetical protein
VEKQASTKLLIAREFDIKKFLEIDPNAPGENMGGINMKIWSLEEDVNVYEHITLLDGSNDKWLEFNDIFKEKSLKNNWKPLDISLIEHGGKLKRGDIPYLSPGKPVLTERAVKVLDEFLEGCVEILPLNYDLQNLYLINVINRIDSIDYKKSDIDYMRDGKRILSVNKYSFIKDKVENQHIFKILDQLWGTVFVSDEFRNKVIESGLEGFKFIEVWDSEE